MAQRRVSRRDRRRNRDRVMNPAARPRKALSPWLTPLLVVGVLVGLVAAVVVSRLLTQALVPVLYGWSDGDHRRLVAFLLVPWATIPFLVDGALRLQARWGRWAGAPCWVVVAGLALLLFGFIPGRSDGGRRGRELTEAAGGTLLEDTGSVFVGAALAAVACLLVAAPIVAAWTGMGPFRPTSTTRLVTGATAYVAVWVAAGAIVVGVVGPGQARGDWLDQTADVLRGGDDGLTGEFRVGLDPSILDVVDCDTARDRLRVDGERPELDGCRKALLVAATGRYDRDGARTTSGQLVAVVVQVRTQGQLDDLDASLDDATIVGGDGLPEPTGDSLVSPADAAFSLVVSVEDTGDIPLPAEGAGRRPLSRALSYALIGTAIGLYVAPPEE